MWIKEEGTIEGRLVGEPVGQQNIAENIREDLNGLVAPEKYDATWETRRRN